MNDGGDSSTQPPRDGLSRMKVHLRKVPIRGTIYHVVTLRPGMDVKFSTNFYHNTWHILSDAVGSRILGRLMWGLAFQRQLNTLVLIASPHLQPSPFDGAPSWPVVLTVQGLCPLIEKDLKILRKNLHRLPKTTTIRWDTHGFAGYERPASWEFRGDLACRTALRGGLICHTASALEMKHQSSYIGRLTPDKYVGMWYEFLDDNERADGEVQVFDDYRQRVTASVVARKRVLDAIDRRVSPDELEDLVCAERDRFRKNRGGFPSRSHL
jgi:hypothetical protein